MYLRDMPPIFDDGEAAWTHKSGGEHAHKFFNDYDRINVLRTQLGCTAEADNFESFAAKLHDADTHVIIAHHGSLGPLIAYTEARHIEDEEAASSVISVDQMLVRPEYQGYGMSGWLLRKLIEDKPFATDLRFATAAGMLPIAFTRGLQRHGFSEGDDGRLTLALPGPSLPPPHRGFDHEAPENRDALLATLAAIPEGWNGNTYMNEHGDDWTRYYRNGQVVGMLMRDPEGEQRWDDDLEESVQRYILADPEGHIQSTLAGATRLQADITLLNAR